MGRVTSDSARRKPQPGNGRGLGGLLACIAIALASGCDDAAVAPSDAGAVRDLPDAARDAGAAPTDAGQPGVDAGAPPPDAAADAGPPADAGPDVDAEIDAGRDAGGFPYPETLADTGLYVEGSTTELAPGVQPFTPRYPLWSDDADKQRWVLLPQGAQIDSSDMDAWQLPIGTKLWKEFSRDGKRLETRLLWRLDTNWYAMAFVWNDAETDAVAAPNGATDVRETDHDVPERSDCATCHEGRASYALGLSAIQLAHSGPGVTLQALVDDGTLSVAPLSDPAPPDTPEWNALGYLHANCGNCHNPASITWDKLDLELWLRTAELTTIEGTRSYLSTVDVALTDTGGSLSVRIAPGDSGMSGLIMRMQTRGSMDAMPPIASEQVDDDGVTLISNWIDGM